MHTVLPVVLLSALFHTVDSENPRFDAKEAQMTLIHRTLDDSAIKLVRGRSRSTKKLAVCDWHGVSCTAGLITSIRASSSISSEHGSMARFNLEWFPPTVEFIHLDDVACSTDWTLEGLPRELRYLCLRVAPHDSSSRTPRVDCALLPRKMEELIIAPATRCCDIRLEHMPSTMRYVYIEQRMHAEKPIVVDYRNLPPFLREMRVTSPRNDHVLEERVRTVGKPRGVKLWRQSMMRGAQVRGQGILTCFGFREERAVLRR